MPTIIDNAPGTSHRRQHLLLVGVPVDFADAQEPAAPSVLRAGRRTKRNLARGAV
jgi:hypothetical protein